MLQRQRPSWSSALLLTAGLLAGTGCGEGTPSTEPGHLKSQTQNRGFGPDLVIRELRGPASIRFGETFTTTVTLCNEGTARAESPIGVSFVNLYLSTSGTLSWPDPGLPPPPHQLLLATIDVFPLGAGQCMTRAFTGAATPPGPWEDGTFYLGAIADVDQVLVELDESNNTAVRALGIGTLPDLVVTEVQGPSSARSGDAFTAAIKVCNQGTQPSTSSTVELYLSTDETLAFPGPGAPPPTDQRLVGTAPLPALTQGQCTIQQVQATVTPPPASTPNQPLYLIAVADAQQLTEELQEDNNLFVRSPMGLGGAPDLVVTSLTAPPSWRRETQFDAAVRICNEGTLPAFHSTVELHVSSNPDIIMPGSGTPLPAGQLVVGQADVPPLSAGHCVTLGVRTTVGPPPGAPSMGALSLAAIVDPSQDVLELREDNNISTVRRVGVGMGPDLVITELRGPSTLMDHWNTTATVSVTVCNEGTDHATTSEVAIQLSMVPTLDPPGEWPPIPATQREIGWLPLPWMAPGQCHTADVEVYADRPYEAPHGYDSFYLGATVDPWWSQQELREDNNTYVSGRIGVGAGADLVITSIQGPPNVATEPFTVSTRVCNQGTNPANSTHVELSLTRHAFLNAPVGPGGLFPEPDARFSLGALDVPPLEAGDCVTRSTSVTAHGLGHGASSTYYLGGTVDPFASVIERRKDNNTFISHRVGVGIGPDLVIATVTGAPAVRQNGSFTPTLRVCNQGTAPSDATTARVFLTLDPHLRMSGGQGPGPSLPWSYIPAGGLSVPDLFPGQCFTADAPSSVSLPPMTGEVYYLGAIADADGHVSELQEDNNTLVRGRIGVGDGADLVVTELTTSPSARADSAMTATVTLCNQGTDYSNASDLELHMSSIPTATMPRWDGSGPPWPETQTPVGMVHIPSLSPEECFTQTTYVDARRPYLSIPDQPLYLAAFANVWSGTYELRYDNNTLVSEPIGVGSRPDLIITALQAPSSVAPGSAFDATLTVCNLGTTGSTGSSVEVHLSSEPTLVMRRRNGSLPPLPSTQTSVGFMSLPPINAGGCFTGSIFATAAEPPTSIPGQPLYLGAVVDGEHFEQELREDNNVFVSGRLSIGYGPDLVITSVTGPANAFEHEQFTTTVAVCNQGTDISASTPVDVYLSMEARLVVPASGPSGSMARRGQQTIGTFFVPSLEVGECTSFVVPVTARRPDAAQTEKAFHLGAIINPYQTENELRKDNNTFVGGIMGIGYGPDLVITGISAPPSTGLGSSPFTAVVTVCNQGTDAAASTYVNLYLSTQARIFKPRWGGSGWPYPASQTPIGNFPVQTLNPGQCVIEQVTSSAHRPQNAQPNHPLYLGAVVDDYPSMNELRDDNNTFVAGLIGVGNAPDLVVTSVSGPASVQSGAPFMATLRVCNQGTTAASNASVELYLANSSTLKPPYLTPWSLPEGQQSIGRVTFMNLEPGQCSTRNVSVTANTPPSSSSTGSFYLGAIADPDWYLEELRKDNNTLADRLILVMP
ncbi:Fibronectin type III domain protein [Myxococcus hansupus]|uniref:Fibronectin type III domain protein n=1 Tax=Pseudomyxococcus hansupus TaxID=1297742 RepID=A0A0H4WKL4_9BACT|nr:CARDB domain-containing protein [Myxococcus hansupus]AKQ63911.1 Fibronectin type III domain protein [Myxococcus hansupus]